MKNMVRRHLAAAVVLATFAPVFAGSDPVDPDCPMVAQLRQLARQVDVMNSTCHRSGELCDTLHAVINESVSKLPTSPVIMTEEGFAFDPDRVFEMINIGINDQLIEDCDPEDEDCNGKVVDPRWLGRQGMDDVQIGNVLLIFPATNLLSAE